MESLRTESVPPPPAVIGSIKAGFDTVAAHMTAILLPLALDLFLWLGPRLSMEKLFLAILPQMADAWRILGFSAEQIREIHQQNLELLPQLNLFWLFRTFPIGISSLVSSPFFSREMPSSPLGPPEVLQVTSDLNLLGWLILLSIAGWIGGALYFRLVAGFIPRNGFVPFLPTGRAIGQSVLISVFWSVIVFLYILLGISPIIGQVAVFVVSLMSMWLIVPLFFWPHGVFLRNENVLTAIWSSWRLTRLTLPASSMFVLAIFLLSSGLNYLWTIPANDSWMALVGILGHAFVTTALLAGSFIYYRDLNIWMATILERMRSKTLMRTR